MESLKEYLIKNKKTIILIIIILGLITGNIYQYLKNKEKISEKEEELTILTNLEIKEQKEEKELFKVDIKGEINYPGIYEIEEGKRVIDAINLAGGLTKNADTKANNLSLKVIDEMVIIIYSKDQIKEFTKTKEEEEKLIENCQKEENNIKNDTCIKQEPINTKEKTSVSINNATLEELMTIPGIGSSKAQKIIEYRNNNGPFTTIEDIKNVSGIGDGVYAKIKDYITI